VAPVASFNNEIGLPLTVLRADADTRVLVLEMGADAPGNLTFLTSVAPPDVAAVLVVGRAHLHGFGSIEGVAATKAELVQGLVPGGVAVLNADDHRVAAMATHADRVVAFGTDPAAAVRAEAVTTDDDGHAAFDLVAPQGRAHVRLALVGAHHVTNALAAAAVALELGVPLPDVAATLVSTGPISPHRMHVVDTPGGVRVVDDAYNATPDSMRAALRTLADMALQRRRSIAVLGEMRELGPDSVREHDAVGALVAELGIDRLVVVGRGALAVHTAATHARDWQGSSTWVETVADAVALLADELRPDDVVLVKSSNGAGLLRLADAIVSTDGASA
jgi:UDP-N-acetylmuramoyl-tripeptide--D-alanyl-D-alanine ligase